MMPEFTTDIVLDMRLLSRLEMDDFFVFTRGVAIRAAGFLRGLDMVRLILTHPDLRRPIDGAYDPISINRARVRYPFLFLGAEDTDPLLYREF